MPNRSPVRSPLRSPVRLPFSEFAQGATAVMDSLQTEANGLAFDFTQPTPQLVIRDTATEANNFNGSFNTKVTSAYASTKRILNGAGSYEAVTVPTPEYNSSGVVLGIPFEGARTNEIRNNSMQGASAPSTFPTFWNGANSAGCSWSVVGTGTEDGIEYIDIRISGTAGSGFPQYTFESSTAIVATSGQAWTASMFCYLVSGSLTGINSTRLMIREGTSGGTGTVSTDSTFTSNDTTDLKAARRTHTVASTDASTQRVTARLEVREAASGAVDATFRIGWPQLEQAAFASSPIRTTNAAVTRSADNAILAVANFPSMSAGGHMVAQWVPGTVASGFYSVFGPTQDGSNVTQIQASATGKRAKNTIAGADAPGLVPTGTLAVGTQTTVAYSFAANNYDAASDGGSIQSSASGAALPTYAQLYFGASGASGNLLFGWLRKGKIVPRTLTDAEVVTLSTLT
jgi:hypothetical protein